MRQFPQQLGRMKVGGDRVQILPSPPPFVCSVHCPMPFSPQTVGLENSKHILRSLGALLSCPSWTAQLLLYMSLTFSASLPKCECKVKHVLVRDCPAVPMNEHKQITLIFISLIFKSYLKSDCH